MNAILRIVQTFQERNARAPVVVEPAVPQSTPIVIDQTTILSLLLVLLLLAGAYVASLFLLAPSTPKSWRILFIWHVFDALIHFVFEGVSWLSFPPTTTALYLISGLLSIVCCARVFVANCYSIQSYLYNCFFTSAPYSPGLPSVYQSIDPTAGNNFLGIKDKTHGSFYGGESNAFAALWRVYANADRRWGGADPVVISLELLTVLGAGPLAVLVAGGISKGWSMVGFWMVVLATAELYGGFITFCPEWLTGNENLDGSNIMHLYELSLLQ
jgi:hypothetical protein